jgi:hypothetical protein
MLLKLSDAVSEYVVTEIGSHAKNGPIDFSDPYEGFVYDGKTGDLYYDTGSTGFAVAHIAAQGVAPELVGLHPTDETSTSITFGL